MMQAADIIRQYEQILAESSAMVRAAEESRWDDLIDLEAARREHIAQVTAAPKGLLTAPALQARHDSLIRSILAADQKIKSMTETWMTEIQGMLGSMQVERKLAKAYNTA